VVKEVKEETQEKNQLLEVLAVMEERVAQVEVLVVQVPMVVLAVIIPT